MGLPNSDANTVNDTNLTPGHREAVRQQWGGLSVPSRKDHVDKDPELKRGMAWGVEVEGGNHARQRLVD